MSKPLHAAALVVGVFVAVVAVVVGATAATGWRTPHTEAPAATAHAPIHPVVAAPLSSDPAPGSFASRIPDTTVAAQDEALRTRAGVLVAQGKDFRIERVALTHPASVNVRGESMTARSVFRIVITAGPYQMRDMPSILSLGNRPLAMGLESTDLATLTGFTFDRAVLSQGATLSVSWGLPNSQSTYWTSTIEVVR